MTLNVSLNKALSAHSKLKTCTIFSPATSTPSTRFKNCNLRQNLWGVRGQPYPTRSRLTEKFLRGEVRRGETWRKELWMGVPRRPFIKDKPEISATRKEREKKKKTQLIVSLDDALPSVLLVHNAKFAALGITSVTTTRGAH